MNRRAIIPVTAAHLLDLSPGELDELFRGAPAGPIPSGISTGTAIVAAGSSVNRLAARVVHAIAWKGKVFDPARGELRNRIGPTGALAIRAKVFTDASWLDGQESIVIDYGNTSLVVRAIRDEIRMIGRDEYLGIVYCGHRRILHFALHFSA